MKPWKMVVLGMTGAFFGVMLLAGMAFWADIFKVDQNGAVYFRVTDTGNVGIGNPAPDPGSRLVVRSSGTGTTTSALDVQASDGTSRVFVRDDGDVGIGTATPGDKFNIVAGTQYQGLLVGNGTRTIAQLVGFSPTNDEGGLKLLASGTDRVSILANGPSLLNGGNVGIGTTIPTSKLHVVGLPVYANNAAAVAGGLTPGAFYRTGGDPDLICVVH